MKELGIAVGLALVLEGALYALFPHAVRRHMAQILEAPPGYLQRIGLIAAVIGLGLVWFIKS